jgi:hypothetical protein
VVEDRITFPQRGTDYHNVLLSTYPGTLDVDVVSMTIPLNADRLRWDTAKVDEYELERARAWNRSHLTLGFGCVRTGFAAANYSGYHTELFQTFWSLCLLMATVPGVWVAATLRVRTRRCSGLCPICGYDLRATTDRCPECGTAAGESAGKG